MLNPGFHIQNFLCGFFFFVEDKAYTVTTLRMICFDELTLKIGKIFIAWNHYLDVTSSVSNHTCKRKIHPSIVRFLR